MEKLKLLLQRFQERRKRNKAVKQLKRTVGTVQIKRTRVKSTNLHSVGYDPQTKTLEVAFRRKKGGPIAYRYANVESNTFKRIMRSKSKGKAFAKHIRSKHPYTKVND